MKFLKVMDRMDLEDIAAEVKQDFDCATKSKPNGVNESTLSHGNLPNGRNPRSGIDIDREPNLLSARVGLR